jgi:hypothetical protein
VFFAVAVDAHHLVLIQLLATAFGHSAPLSQKHARMATPNTRARANWAVERATALPEV